VTGEIARIAQAVRSRQVCALDVLQTALARIDRLNPALNAVVARCDDEARRAAQSVDDAIAAGGDPGPLAGVPALVKDLEDVAGMPTTQGSLLFAAAPRAAANGTVPGRLVAAGAVIAGKTNLPEFATEGYTSNLLFGTTGNPWEPNFSPGGSSGGSGAAVAAGMSPIATATDGGGSIRIPASFCGLLGLKPTNGVVGRWPAPDWMDLSTEGPIATSAEDLRMLWRILAGPVLGDPTAVTEPALAAVAAGGTVRRLFAVERFGTSAPLPDDTSALFGQGVRDMSALLGVEATAVDPGELFSGANPDSDWFTLTTVEHVARFGRRWVEDSLDQMHPGARAFMEWGLQVTVDDYIAARRRRYLLVRAVDELLGDDGVLISPTMPVSGWLADGRMSDSDEPGMLPEDAFNTAVQNITGHPALSLPAGVAPNGVPFGLQATGPRYRDGLLLGLADLWEQAYPWPPYAPGYEGLADSLGLS
jgi:Asp-tRNA(Asn)/Glu-tRNA(Gln) amidotransferase A subunit family amidase